MINAMDVETMLGIVGVMAICICLLLVMLVRDVVRLDKENSDLREQVADLQERMSELVAWEVSA